MDSFGRPPQRPQSRTNRTVMKKQSFIYRYPRAFSSVSIVVLLSVFFSRQIYDVFFSDMYPGLANPLLSDRPRIDQRRRDSGK